MKKIGIILLVFLGSISAFCQTGNNKEEEVTQVFTIVEKMPLFNGAISQEESSQKVNDFIAESVKSANLNVSGTVYVSYTIDTSGTLTKVQVLRGISKEADEVAISITNRLQNWTPGSQRGRLVPVIYTQAVKF